MDRISLTVNQQIFVTLLALLAGETTIILYAWRDAGEFVAIIIFAAVAIGYAASGISLLVCLKCYATDEKWSWGSAMVVSLASGVIAHTLWIPVLFARQLRNYGGTSLLVSLLISVLGGWWLGRSAVLRVEGDHRSPR